jgi:hypothetical protein
VISVRNRGPASKALERYIEECRREAKLLSPEGQTAMQKYEELIAMARGQDKKR